MNENTAISEGKSQNRKLKKIYNKIKKQMEFYFSDSNLAKDKFLFDLISKNSDGFVEIDIFKKFNKIKALTNSCEVIATSVSRSNMFEISPDGKKIRRVAPLEFSKDFDACTLYVEKLPQNANEKWVKDVLGQFGPITYVNVPRFKATNKIKGFAFVEFENTEGVNNACEFYKLSVEKEETASEDESKSLKNATKKHKHEESPYDKKVKKNRTRSTSESSDKLTDFSFVKSEKHQEASDKDLDYDQENSHQKSKKKRKRGSSESEIAVKRLKELPDEDQDVLVNKCDIESKTEQLYLNEDSTVQEECLPTENEKAEVSNTYLNGTKTDKKKNKRKKKSSRKHNTEKPLLRVMPKSEWKVYRSKYLELQRSTMSLLKKQILHETQELKEQEGNTKSEVTETKKSLQFMPSIIINIKLAEPVKNPSEIKTQVKANAVVAYVDAPVENSEIFIRCHNSEDAQTIVKEKKLSHLGNVQIIEGEEERKYWEKIEIDRKNKFNNPVINKKRGRDKLIAKAAKLEEMKNKHIYFDD